MLDFEMTLFRVITHGFQLSEAYECPKNETFEYFKRPILGSYFLFSGIFFIVLYIPCFVVMFREKSRPPVFLVMMILAIFDIISLSVNSIITGFLDILGLSFCHSPLFIYISGAIGTGTWMGGCVACILLAIDRCVETNAKFCLGFLFHKNKFPLVVLLMMIYWLYSCLFTNPALFTSEYSSWFFDPKIGMDPSIYRNFTHTINNLLVSAMTTVLYIYLCIYLLCKKSFTNSMWECRKKNQIILQSIILCSFHAMASYIYEYMQLFYSPPILFFLGQLFWQLSNGCFCVVYLTINRTIRNSVLRLLFTKRFRESFGLYVAPDEKTGTVSQVSPEVVNESVGGGGVVRNTLNSVMPSGVRSVWSDA